MPSLFKLRNKSDSVLELSYLYKSLLDKNVPEYDARKILNEKSMSQNKYRTEKTSERMVNSAIKFVKNGMRLESDPVSFSYEELDFIHSISDDVLERELFILFCLYKTRGDIFDFEKSKFIYDCKIKKSELCLDSLITKDKDDNLFYCEMCKDNTGMNKTSDYIKSLYNENDIAFTINHYDNVIYYYEMYKNPKGYMFCEKCGKIIKKTKNVRKYCTECSKLVKNSKNKTYQYYKNRGVGK